MGELAEAIRRANEEEAAREDRSSSSPPERAAAGRTLSLDEVLGHVRRGEAAATSGDPGDESTRSAGPRSAAPGPRELTASPGVRKEAPIQPVAREPGAARAERISILDGTTPGAAAARRIAQKVKRRAASRDIHSIAITSSLRGEGKTTTACNLAIALTQLDRSESVVLVDLDLRRPSVARSLGLTPVRTIRDVIERRVSLDEALLVTDIPGLTVLATDRGTSTPEALLASQNLRSLIDQLERRFSRVVIDTPPALVVSDAASVIDAADAYVFVAKAGSTPTKSIRGALDHLPREKVLGCVLNHARDAGSIPTEYYYYGDGDAPTEESAPARADAEEPR
ncbi:MAG: AAA family ATPase [Myxococcota bacterium]